MAIDMEIPAKEGGSGAWAELEPDTYRAQVTDIEDVGISDLYPADGPRLKFTFALLDEQDDEGHPITLYKWCSQKVSGGAKPSNLWKWAEAMGVPPQVGQPFRVSALLNRECRVLVETKTPQNGGDPRPNITNILPAKTEKGKRAPLAQRVAAEPADDEGIGECVMCDQPGVAFNAKGGAVCAAHMPK